MPVEQQPIKVPIRLTGVEEGTAGLEGFAKAAVELAQALGAVAQAAYEAGAAIEGLRATMGEADISRMIQAIDADLDFSEIMPREQSEEKKTD